MGLFGKKVICSLCNVQEGKNKVADGCVCNTCYQKCRNFLTPEEMINYKTISLSTLQNAYYDAQRSEDLKKIFSPTQNIKNHFYLDEANRLWGFIDNTYGDNKKIIYRYEDIQSFELLQDGESIVGGGLGSAIAGGLLFGATGSIVGAVVGNKRIKTLIQKFQIKIKLECSSRPCYMNLLKGPGYGMRIKSGTPLYRETLQEADEILEALNKIAEKNRPEESGTSTNDSLADEINKLKELLDSGVIQEEEFKEAKTKLLK